MPERIFEDAFFEYKKNIDLDIEVYSNYLAESTISEYGSESELVINAYIDLLKCGGKRFRGSLVLIGYEMLGGRDKKMIIQAARAIEMLHAYFLIIDDIQDRSLTRRANLSTYAYFEDYHKKNELKGDPEQFGISMALNAAGMGNHAAQMILANLNVDEQLKLKALGITNRTSIITFHGQTKDIMNKYVSEITEDDIKKIMEWKTANYSVINPLHVGMVLAGAECEDTDAITEYGTNVGKAYQLINDYEGIFSVVIDDNFKSSDICEGNNTLLIWLALRDAKKIDSNFLADSLGSRRLSKAEFMRCREIIINSGAVNKIKEVVVELLDEASASLEKAPRKWGQNSVKLLSDLATNMKSKIVT